MRRSAAVWYAALAMATAAVAQDAEQLLAQAKKRWFGTIGARPAVKRGMAVPS